MIFMQMMHSRRFRFLFIINIMQFAKKKKEGGGVVNLISGHYDRVLSVITVPHCWGQSINSDGDHDKRKICNKFLN